MLELIEQVWNKRNFAVAAVTSSSRDVFLHSSGETTYIRPKGYQDETLRLLLAFPAATFEVRDIQTNDNPRYAGLRISVLWKMTGAYDGRPLYGPVTNQDVDLLGVSQFLVQDGRVVRERRLFDEIALRAQINQARGDEPLVGPGQHLLRLRAEAAPPRTRRTHRPRSAAVGSDEAGAACTIEAAQRQPSPGATSSMIDVRRWVL